MSAHIGYHTSHGSATDRHPPCFSKARSFDIRPHGRLQPYRSAVQRGIIPYWPRLLERLPMSEAIVTPGRYVKGLRQWMPLEQADLPSLVCDTLTVATLNVWHAPDFFQERCHATLALLASLQSDLIALQEVSPRFLDQILSTPWIQTEYCLSDIYGSSIDPYGVLILSRIPICAWHLVALPSAMGRHLVSARAFLNGQRTTFASVHLESLAYAAPTRAKQLRRIFPVLAPEPHVILTGDFNFCATWEENRQLEPSYQDIWSILYPEQAGYTEDTERNTMRMRHTGKPKQVRFDRVLLRSHQPGWHAEAIALIGAVPISDTTPEVFPSDHFGLVSRLRWQTGA
jgi:tyrosyl-DNA phosphodiesterase 2